MFPIICVGGPTGAGKDTVLQHFLSRQNDTFVRIPRSTTRPKRNSEIEGLHYNFLSDETFLELEKQGELCAIDNFCGYKYGINFNHISNELSQNRRIIGVFGVCAYRLREIYNDGKVFLIYISAPIDTLKQRLIERGDTLNVINERIIAAKKQLEEEPINFDFIILNNGHINDAVLELEKIIKELESRII